MQTIFASNGKMFGIGSEHKVEFINTFGEMQDKHYVEVQDEHDDVRILQAVHNPEARLYPAKH